jgi:hypothetical protein
MFVKRSVFGTIAHSAARKRRWDTQRLYSVFPPSRSGLRRTSSLLLDAPGLLRKQVIGSRTFFEPLQNSGSGECAFFLDLKRQALSGGLKLLELCGWRLDGMTCIGRCQNPGHASMIRVLTNTEAKGNCSARTGIPVCKCAPGVSSFSPVSEAMDSECVHRAGSMATGQSF